MKTEWMPWVASHKVTRMQVLKALKVGTVEQLKTQGLTLYVLTDPSGEGVSFSLHISCVEFKWGGLRVHLSHKPTFVSSNFSSLKTFRIDFLEFCVNKGWDAFVTQKIANDEFVPWNKVVDHIHVELGHVYGDGHGGD